MAEMSSRNPKAQNPKPSAHAFLLNPKTLDPETVETPTTLHPKHPSLGFRV